MTVARWHANDSAALRRSGDCIEAHQWRVADLVRRICATAGWPLTVDLLLAALYHDEAERELGDMPAPAKRRFPELAEAYRRAEVQILDERGLLFEMPLSWRAILSLADKADAWRWAVIHGQGDTDEWRDAKRECMRMAWAQGEHVAAWWLRFVSAVEP